jgi:4-hydroxybenzoate polyprenyltransferase
LASHSASSQASRDRARIAQAAARLIAEHGLSDWAVAKRKACRELGLSDREALPANEEIEQALRDYNSLFQPQEQAASLHAQRMVALDWMQRLAPWRPMLVGGVAAGSLSIVLALVALALGALVGAGLFAVLVAYVALNLTYSLRLKRIVIIDVFALSLGFLLRILAGTVGVGIAPSPWLLMCGLMLTLLLGFGKRRAEGAVVGAAAGRAVLAEYSPALLDRLIVVCVSGTLIAYSLYTISPQTIALHGSADLVYTVPIVTYALFRYLYLLGNGRAAEDPSGLFVGDRHLQVSALAWLVAVIWILR